MTPLRTSETTIDPFASTPIPKGRTSLFPSDTFVTAPLVGRLDRDGGIDRTRRLAMGPDAGADSRVDAEQTAVLAT